MSRSGLHSDDSHLDLTSLLEQHIVAGFPPDLALDLVLNELVVRAAEATRASAAAIALSRGNEMVCRAATGHLAPDLGVPLSTRDGLSGACLQTRQPQLSVDTEFDPRIDPAVSRRLGIRSILIVPVIDAADNDKSKKDGGNAQFAGVLEVFSMSPAAFSHLDQKRLEGFAEDCVRLRRASFELSRRRPAAVISAVPVAPEVLHSIPARSRRPPYEAWTLVIGGLAILAIIGVSFLIGSRIGWLGSNSFRPPDLAPPALNPPAKQVPFASKANETTARAPAPKAASVPSVDELVVYEKGKVVFRMRPVPTKSEATGRVATQTTHSKPVAIRQEADSIVEASSTTKIASSKTVWLAPAQAEGRLLSRIEPHYPPDALAAHRAGSVVLEVHVAEDGTVSSVRPISGDPLLSVAAAEAVRGWRYQPYRRHDRAAQFQTDVTLKFSLPN